MRRFYKSLKWCLFGGLGIAGIFLVANGILAARAGARLEGKIAALRAAGEPVSLADLTGPPILSERNAETYLRRAKESAEAIEKEIQTAYWAASNADIEAFDGGRPTPALQQSLQTALATYPNANALIEEASHCPDYDPQFDFNTDVQGFRQAFAEQMVFCRTVIRVADYQARAQLGEGHPEEAFQTCLAMFRLTRLFDRIPTVGGQLVCLALRGVAVYDTNLVLRSGPLPVAAYAALEQELSLHGPVERYGQSLRSDRALTLQWFREIAVEKAPTPSLLPGFRNDECDYLDVMKRCIQDAALPYFEWNRTIFTAFPRRQVGPMTRSILRGLYDAHGDLFAGQSELRALRVLNALLEREQASNGGEPTLANLGLPADAIADPFNDEPLHIKKLPSGWLVYSVGMDLKDDGGDLTDNHDVGVGPQPAAKADGGQGPLP